jgi:hypothetical protein
VSRTARAVVACLAVLVICASAWAQMPEGWDRLLGPNRGRPYRGLIIDSDTKAPLAGAVVVALWVRERVYPLQVNTEHYAVRETVTDAEGRFVMEVKDIEEGAPRRTRKPEFLVYLPGYGSFPHGYTSPKGFVAELFEGSWTTVELPRLANRERRLNVLSGASPHRFSGDPERDLPLLTKAVDEERVALGLDPPGVGGKK